MKVAALGYVVIDATDPEDWARFGADVMGLSAHAVADNVALRMDDRGGRPA